MRILKALRVKSISGYVLNPPNIMLGWSYTPAGAVWTPEGEMNLNASFDIFLLCGAVSIQFRQRKGDLNHV